MLLLTVSLAWAANPEGRGPLNQHTPSWLTLNAAARFRAEDYQGVDFREDDQRGFLLQRYRFSAGVRARPWLRVFGEMQDAREAGGPHPSAGLKDSLDLRQAWVNLGTEKGIWDVRAGRQMLAFGAERVVGAGEWGNTARVFDAVKLGLHHGVDRLDVFAASVVRNDVVDWDHHQDGDDLHGAYASLRSLLPNVSLEPYLLYRTSPSFTAGDGAAGPYDSWTYGFRAAGSGLERWAYEAEVTGQRGEIGANRLAAWAFTAVGRRMWNAARWKPSAEAEYSFASGDRRTGDGVINTLDQLYPTNHGKYGITDQVGRRNMKDLRAGVQLHPWRRVSVKTEGHSFWLANRNDGLYSAGGGISIPAVPGGAVSSDIGRELDLSSALELSKGYALGLQVGHLFPGRFVRTYSPGAGRTFYTVYLDLHI